MASAAGGRDVFPTLQVLRTVSAVLVACYHLNAHFELMTGRPRIHSLTYFGFVGVDIFFCISGAVIWYTTDAAHGLRDSSAFIYRRLVRIYPPYWFWLTTLYLIVALLWPLDLEKYLNVAFSAYALMPVSTYVLPIAWTLTYELAFYTLFAVVIALPRVAAAWVLAAAAATVVLMALLGSAYLLHGVSLTFMLEFIGGCAAMAGAQRYRGRGAGLALAVSGLLFLAAVMWQIDAGRLMVQSELVRVSVFGPASALLVYGLLALDVRGGVTVPKWLVRSGDWSYAIYLSHWLMIMLVVGTPAGGALMALPTTLRDIGLVLLIALTILTSAIVAETIEWPLYRFLKRQGARRRPATKYEAEAGAG
jgi:exopolysaccharide production protein ExoZ